MPQRQSVVKVPTPEAQGDDSWVCVRKLTVKERGQARKMANDLIDKALATEDMAASGKNPSLYDQLRAQKTGAGLQGDTERMTLDLFRDHIVEWNWVNDDGEPLPQPKDDPAVFDRLLDNEVAELNRALGASAAEQKN